MRARVSVTLWFLPWCRKFVFKLVSRAVFVRCGDPGKCALMRQNQHNTPCGGGSGFPVTHPYTASTCHGPERESHHDAMCLPEAFLRAVSVALVSNDPRPPKLTVESMGASPEGRDTSKLSRGAVAAHNVLGGRGLPDT